MMHRHSAVRISPDDGCSSSAVFHYGEGTLLVYAIKRSCPIECLEPLLNRLTFAALAEELKHSPGTATVGAVIELYEQNRLTDIYNISTGRAGEIRSSLIRVGLIDPASRIGCKHVNGRGEVRHGHHVTCPDYVHMNDG
jgi:hypothetical protein